MNKEIQALTEYFISITDHAAPTTDTDQQHKGCRLLVATIIHALRSKVTPQIIASWINWRIRNQGRPHERQRFQSKPITDADLDAQIQDVKRVRKITENSKRGRSKLDPHRAEILRLRRKSSSWKDIICWLRRFKRLEVSKSALIDRVKIWES